MSLKAKIEAVIYASEEPVTLAQLVGLLGHEAQAELDHLESAQHALTLEDEPSDPETLNSEILSEPDTAEQVAAEQQRAAALEHALHVAAAEEAAAARAARHHAEADAAAMSSGDVVEVPASAEPTDLPEQEISSTEPLTGEEKDNKKVARERERRLRDYFRTLLDQLIAEYAGEDRGLEIREVANGYRFATKPEYHDAVRGFVKSLKPPLKLSLQALETLAVVAYKQPVTAPEISEIRGVDSGGVLGSLMSRKLVTTAGRKQVIGRPILYKTTRDFLLRFGLKDIGELPSIEEFEKMAGELAEQEEIPMDHMAPETPGELEPERNVSESQADGYSDEEPADEIIVDGRNSGLPPTYDRENPEAPSIDSEELDAKIQSDAQLDSEHEEQ
jgi:segregation and condensation protein B